MKNDKRKLALAYAVAGEVADLSMDNCPWCIEASWYGEDHMSSCPVTWARVVRRDTKKP